MKRVNIMNRVIAVSMLLLAGCVDRTENLDLFTTASVEFEIPEMVAINGPNGIKGEESEYEKGVNTQYEYNNDTGIVTDDREALSYSDTRGAVYARNKANENAISEAVFYIFDEKGLFVSKNVFVGPENYELEFKNNGRHTVYVLCNISEYVDLPDTPTQAELEALAIPHRSRYDRLPFAGKTQVEAVSGGKPNIRLRLERLNSAIRIENASVDRMDLASVTVSGLPSRGNIFGTDTEAAGVTYGESAEADIDADGNAVVYSFLVPDTKISGVKIEAEAKIKSGGESAFTVAPVTFLERLETGKQATASVGYLESGNLKIGIPESWGNTDSHELPDGIRLQVVGGEFFDYKGAKALRAFSGGDEFSFIVTSAYGAVALEHADASVDWVEIGGNTITVSGNGTSETRECRIAVVVDGVDKGVFYIAQGRAIAFTGLNGVTVNDGRVEMIGGSGSSAATSVVSFGIDDEELADIDIVAANNGASGITVDIDRANRRLVCHFMSLVDASVVDADGVSVPVEFVDRYGAVRARIVFSQRPAKIAVSPSQFDISHDGGTVTASVTVEGDANWNVRSITDRNGAAVSWLPKPAGSFKSGSNMVLTVPANTTADDRTVYAYIQGRYTVSKPCQIRQVTSYGIRNLSVDAVWDAEASTLKAYSKERDYTFTFDTDDAVPSGRFEVVNRTPGSVVAVGSQPAGTEPETGHSFVISVPASASATEPESVFDIMADDRRIGGFVVKQAKKPSISVAAPVVIGGSGAVAGRFTASAWDVVSKDYVISSDRDNLSVTLPETNDGTFIVNMAATMDSNFINRSATISLVGTEGALATCTVAQNKVEYVFSKTNAVFGHTADTSHVVVTSPNAGTISSGMTVTSSVNTWCKVGVSGNRLIIDVANNSDNSKARTATLYVTYRNCKSQSITVMQESQLTVIICGKEWFKFDLVNPRQDAGGATFASKLPSACTGVRTEAHGKFYQWSVNVAWSATNPLAATPSGNWKSSISATSWADDPCPDGFRLPSDIEYSDLSNRCVRNLMSGTWNASNYGYITFTQNGAELEFVGIGMRSTNGTLTYPGTNGRYWTSKQSVEKATHAHNMYFDNSNNYYVTYNDKRSGFSVRCVRDIPSN